MLDRNTVRWCVKDHRVGDILENDTLDGAVEEYLDGIGTVGDTGHPETLEQKLRDLGEIVVECWVRHETKARPPLVAATLVEDILDRHFEEQASPDDGYAYHVTPAMIEAAKGFIAVMLHEFVPWTMTIDRARNVKVNALVWVLEHRPHWLKAD